MAYRRNFLLKKNRENIFLNSDFLRDLSVLNAGIRNTF